MDNGKTNYKCRYNLVCGVRNKEQGIIVLLQWLSNNKKAEKVVLEKLDAVFQSQGIEDAYMFSKFNYL